MKQLRNPELKKELIVYLVITAAAAAGAFFVTPAAALVTAALGLALCAAHLFFAKKRYLKMEELSDSLQRILNGDESIRIAQSTEGELSILQTEIHKMTERLLEQTDALKADKIRLTEAIEDIFHQIRTPLTSMNLIVSLLQKEENSYERRLELTYALKKDLERIKWLVETLLKLSKLDAGTVVFQKDLISTEDIIKRAAQPLLIPMELREQSFEVECPNANITGDMNRCVEAFSNIIKNCMEHTPPGGKITVLAEENALFTQITVKDTGPGFAKEELPHLFERFYRGENSSDDSIGIGLALSRSLITAQNGTITAENAPDGGAVFTVRFYKSVV